MNRFKFLAAGDVARVDEDGKWRQSFSTNHPMYQEYVAAGGQTDPYVPSAEELQVQAAVAKQRAMETDKTVARQNTKLQALAEMTPAQVQAWVEANVRTLPDAKDLLGTLAIAVSILARQL